MTDVPHFRMPFDFGDDGHAIEVEQNSMDDVAGCVEVILRTPRGFREELPGFGRTSPVFQAPPNEEMLRRAAEEWEPRTPTTIEGESDAFDVGLRRVRATVEGER